MFKSYYQSKIDMSNDYNLRPIYVNSKCWTLKESDLAKQLSSEEEFWDKLMLESLKRMWSKEDDVFDKIWAEELTEKNK